MNAVAPAKPVAIECKGISKRFSGKYAVRDASVTIRAGTVHALVGENGAGKSTLLGMIAGRVKNDTGTITAFGEELDASDPRQTRRHGIAVVYQELTMVPALTAVENVFLGQPMARAAVLSEKAMRARYLQLCEEFDVFVDPDTRARDLSVSQQQIIEIMRAVQAKGRILMLDEPSAALAEQEREVLYRIIDRLRAQGTTIVIVSHNLNEVLSLSDHITVMRDGDVVRSASRSAWDKPSLVRHMVGQDVVIARRATRHALGGEALSVRNLVLPGVLKGIDMGVREREIVGLWGLVGSGRTTFFRSLSGLEPASSGELVLHGEKRPWPSSARTAIAEGIAMVPESRRAALVMGMDAPSNYWLGRRTPGQGMISPVKERSRTAEVARFFGFDPGRLAEPVRHLSGGNQQKVLLAKWAGRRPRVLLVDEPTRGIDVGAKAEVLASLVRLAEEGAAVVVTSSELEEVLAVCDRLLVFAHGEVVKELDTVSTEYSVEEIVRFGFGETEAA